MFFENFMLYLYFLGNLKIILKSFKKSQFFIFATLFFESEFSLKLPMQKIFGLSENVFQLKRLKFDIKSIQYASSGPLVGD